MCRLMSSVFVIGIAMRQYCHEGPEGYPYAWEEISRRHTFHQLPDVLVCPHIATSQSP